MKEYSEFTKEYVDDICTALNEVGARTNLKQPFSVDELETLTELLEEYVANSRDYYTHLSQKGLVNRGRCPFTGSKIDDSFPNYSFMGRKIFVSHEGYSIMKAESDEKYEQIMGRPRTEAKAGGGGCYIATVCYESEVAEEVIALKSFRDKILNQYIVGQIFIKTYYILSPSIAHWLQNKRIINRFIKKFILDRIVKVIKTKL